MSHHEVVVVGAGMAGLTCAIELARRDVGVVVLESSDGVGGRIRTDRIDGMLLDRGFQLLNPAYPALAGLVDVEALELGQFGAGVVVAAAGKRSVLADPRRSPADVVGALDSSTGTLAEKVRAASYIAQTALGAGDRLERRPDRPYGEVLDAAGVTGHLRHRVLDPFLAGVLGEDSQESSRVFVDYQLRMFARGTPGLPAAGMQALPEQLAAGLPAGSVQLGVHATSISGRKVTTTRGAWSASAVVVATSGSAASDLTGMPTPLMRSLTTFYHRTEHSPASRPMLHVDGDRRGPVVNTAVVSDAAASYCRDGALVATTVLGLHQDEASVGAVEGQLSHIYGVPTSDWERVATYAIAEALPAMLPPLALRQEVRAGDGIYVAGDHRDTASIQGAIVSGRRAAAAVAADLGIERP